MSSYRYRGRHRAPSTTGATVARVAVVGTTAVLGPVALAPPAVAAPESAWDRLAACESGGRWDTATGNGFAGGLQFTPSTWRRFGGSGSPQHASRAQQIAVAERVLAGQGWNAWPSCSHTAKVRDYTPDLGQQARARTGEPARKAGDAAPSSTYKPGVATPRRATTPQAATTHHPRRSVATHPATRGSDLYRVRRGDTLVQIAAAHDTTWRKVYEANRRTVTDPALIIPGQRLVMP